MQVAIFLIQRNRHALIGRAIDEHDMQKVLHFLKNDPVLSLLQLFDLTSISFISFLKSLRDMKFLQVVDALYDCKSEVIGPGFFRFKAEIGDCLTLPYTF